MKIRTILCIASTVAFSGSVLAQSEGAAFTLTGSGVSTPFATDYQSIGINPANLGWTHKESDSRFTLGFTEGAYSIYSEALSSQDLRDNIYGREFDDLSRSEKIDIAEEFANSPLALNVDLMSVGFSFASEDFGGIAFSVNEKASYYSELGPLASEILFLGYQSTYFDSLLLGNGTTIANSPNLDQETYDQVVEGFTGEDQALPLAQLLDGTEINGQWVREINVAYGRKVFSTDNIEIYGGVGLKYVMGMFLMDLKFENNEGRGVASYAPIFDFDTESISGQNPSSLPRSNNPLKPAGQGLGVDIGASLIIKEALTLSAGVNDIGSVTWDGNVFRVQDLKLTELTNPGVTNLSLIDQLDTFIGEDGILKWEGEQEIVRSLPTTIRAGAGLQLGEKISVGVDAVLPANEAPGNIRKPLVSLGGRVSPIPWLQLSAGFITGGNYDFKIPAGVVFRPKGGMYEAGVASRDLITFFSENQPTLSLAMGFMRFRF